MDSQQIPVNYLDIWQQKLANGVSLVGPLLNSLKHGDFYYLYYDGTKQFAGQYENDLKEGVWFELKLPKPIERYELDKYIDYINLYQINIIQNQLQIDFDELKQQTISHYSKGVKLPIYGKLDYSKQYQNRKFNQYFYKIILNKENGLKNKDQIINLFIMDIIKIVLKQEIGIFIIKVIIGGGDYNDKGQKIGEWREVESNFNEKHNYQSFGSYTDDIKVGEWKTIDKGRYKIMYGIRVVALLISHQLLCFKMAYQINNIFFEYNLKQLFQDLYDIVRRFVLYFMVETVLWIMCLQFGQLKHFQCKECKKKLVVFFIDKIEHADSPKGKIHQEDYRVESVIVLDYQLSPISIVA